MHGILTRDGVELHYWATGPESGPVVVLTHGVAMDHRMWEPQFDVLGERYRVIVHDVRGHGRSTCSPTQFSPRAAAADLVALLDDAGVESAVLVGHSLGGTICQLAALQRPERVRALVGIGSACVTIAPTIVMRAFSRLSPGTARRMGPARMRADVAKRAGVQPEVREYARRTAEQMDHAMFETVLSVGFGDYENVPGYRLGVPLLLMRGDHDGYGALLSSAPKWAERDGGEFLLVPHAAHNAGQDNPAFVNQHLLAFLDRLPTE